MVVQSMKSRFYYQEIELLSLPAEFQEGASSLAPRPSSDPIRNEKGIDGVEEGCPIAQI